MYADGEGVPKNSAEAAKWYRKAAEQGDATGQFYLGAMYAKGEGVPKNDVEAYKWFNLVAEQGDHQAKQQRELLEKRMKSGQIAEGQRLSREFRPRPVEESN